MGDPGPGDPARDGRHGAQTAPEDTTEKIPEAAARISEGDHRVIGCFQSPASDIAGRKDVASA